jgi:hypothetical protein
VAPRRVLPSSIRRGFDHAPEQAPADVRVRPDVARRYARRDIRRETRERALVPVLSAVEAELKPCAQRKAGAIREKVTHGRAFGPAASAQLRHVHGHRIIQRQLSCSSEPSDHRGDHRLGQGPGAESRLGCDRLAGPHVCDSAVGGRCRPFAKDPDRRPRHRMPRSVLTKQSRQIALVHATNPMTRQARTLPRSATYWRATNGRKPQESAI